MERKTTVLASAGSEEAPDLPAGSLPLQWAQLERSGAAGVRETSNLSEDPDLHPAATSGLTRRPPAPAR